MTQRNKLLPSSELIAINASAWLTPEEAGLYLGLSALALNQRRHTGTGPRYAKVGRLIRCRKVRGTSHRGGGGRGPVAHYRPRGGRSIRRRTCNPPSFLPFVLQGTFQAAADAMQAVDQVLAAGSAAGGHVINTAQDAPWITDGRGDASRRAGGATITVRHEWEGYVCRVDDERFGNSFTTAPRACEWFDQHVPPPHPHHRMQLIPRRLRHAVQAAARDAAGDADRFADRFAELAAGALYLLRQAGMDDGEEAALITALMTGGHPVVWEAGYAGVVV